MRRVVLSIPEVAFIARTRGALGVGIGLLLASRIPESRRRPLGLALFAVGALSTIPAAMKIFRPRPELIRMAVAP